MATATTTPAAELARIAVGRIDRALATYGGRSLISADELTDLLLDLRQPLAILASTNERATNHE